jgi:hypothetical protein
MVKLTSFLALSTLIIVPTLASELWDLETLVFERPFFLFCLIDEFLCLQARCH